MLLFRFFVVVVYYLLDSALWASLERKFNFEKDYKIMLHDISMMARLISDLGSHILTIKDSHIVENWTLCPL